MDITQQLSAGLCGSNADGVMEGGGRTKAVFECLNKQSQGHPEFEMSLTEK